LVGDQALSSKFFEREVNALAADMAVKESPDLFSGQAFLGFVQSLANAVDNGVAGSGAEEHGGATALSGPVAGSGGVLPDVAETSMLQAE
jgi:hypothetical protein